MRYCIRTADGQYVQAWFKGQMPGTLSRIELVPSKGQASTFFGRSDPDAQEVLVQYPDAKLERR